MKKTLLFLFAICTMTFAVVSITSCKDDDKESYVKEDAYTMKVEFYSSTFTEAELQQLQTVLDQACPPKTVTCTEANARVSFNLAISSYRSILQKICNDTAEESGCTDFSIIFKLLNSKGTVIASETFTPQSY